ncbi:MAG TPA: class I SAM-dependent methyltransferase [Nitrospira sp.]|nr:class I SAM-dependent methyltransferase [Nitrospira sp.]
MSKLSRLILSPSDELIGALLKDSRATLVYRTGDICVIESADRTLVESSQDSGRKWTRIFEEYHLANADNDKAQGVVVGAFFNWLADRYSNEIDSTKNLACYEALYDIANQFRETPTKAAVLDVGCGPGTILRSSVARAAQVLVGYDISEVSAQAASSAGLTVMSREQLLAGPARFDVALSAYTMHYACDLAETLKGVQCNIKPGGVWALNFHKGIGLGAFLACLESSELELVGQVSHSSFGPIVAVKMG